MVTNIDPREPDYIQLCVAQRRRTSLTAALASSGCLTQAELADFVETIEQRVAVELKAEEAELRLSDDLSTRLRRVDYPITRALRVNAALEVALKTVNGFRSAFFDEPRFPISLFRRWFIRAELGLDCEQAALDAMSAFPITIGDEVKPAFLRSELETIPELLLSLREYLIDYLVYDGLSRYELAKITRAQLGLQAINGSVPPAWHGLSFRDMVRVHLGLIAVPASPAVAESIRHSRARLAATPN